MDSAPLPGDLISKLIDLVRTGVLLVDRKGIVRFANDCAASIFGFSGEELNGTPVRTLFLPDDHDIFLPNIMSLTLRGQGFEGEALLVGKSGEKLFVNISSSLFHDDSGDRDLLIFTVQDISRLKRLERDYRDSERFAGLGRLTDQIAHQIRNPIVSIGGFAHRLAREPLRNEDLLNYVNIILSETDRLNYLITRLVEFTHVHSLRYESLTSAALCEQALNSVRHAAESAGVSLACASDGVPHPEPFYGDRRLLMKAVISVMQNAVESVPSGGAVCLRWTDTPAEIAIMVEDEGEGIAPRYLPFIFDPFFSTKFDHLGLGLTMARRIVTEHRGRISATNRSPAGTQVVISLPKDRRRSVRTKLVDLEIVRD